MATIRGMDGSVTVGGSAVANVTQWSLTAPREKLDASVMGDSSKTYKLGMKDWSGQVTCRFDYGDTTGQKAILDAALAASPTALAFEFVTESSGTTFSGSAYPELQNAAAALSQIDEIQFNLIPAGDLTVA